MKKSNCPNCKSAISEKTNFCGKCGLQLRCSECKGLLDPDNSFCENCGTKIQDKTSASGSPNRIKFHENVEGRSFEAEFTDEVGKDITTSLGDVLTARQIALGSRNTPNAGSSNVKDPVSDQVEDVSFEETKDVEGVHDANKFPSLQNIAIKNLASTESEWVVVYSFYASEFGRKVFNRKDLVSLYEKTNRKTPSRIKNLTAYIKAVVKSDDINPLNNKGDYSMLDAGVKRAKEIIFRKSGSSGKMSSLGNGNNTRDRQSNDEKIVKQADAKKGTGSTRSPSIVGNLNLRPKGKDSLKDFYGQFDVKTNLEKNLIFVYYLEKSLQEPERGVDHIYTCYKEVGSRVPGNLYQSLIDTKNKRGWLRTSNMSVISVEIGGENALEHDLKRKS